MAEFIDIVARLRARERGYAIPIVSQRQQVIQPHALILTMLAMAGEDTSVHAIAVGRVGEPAEINVAADPRDRDAQYALLRWLLPRIEAYYAWCRNALTFPQIWVSSAGALGHLDTLGDRLRFTDEPDMQRLGLLLSYGGGRSFVAGQQALITATQALRNHFATGQQESEDEHLGALLTWIEPPVGRDIFASVEMAELLPMGFKTDPRFDADDLFPAVQDYNAARNIGDPRQVEHRRARVQQLLEGVIRPIHAGTQRAIGLLTDPRWQVNPALDLLSQQESEAFASYMISRDEGYRVGYRDSPKAAAYRIVARERAVANVEAGALRHDTAAREWGVAGGNVVRASLTAFNKVRIAPRQFRHAVELVSHQDNLHLRHGDVLWTLDGPKIGVLVDTATVLGPFTAITGALVKGMQSIGSIAIGTTLDFGPKAPDWNLVGDYAQMSVRLANTPWTHDTLMPPAAPVSSARPNDLLAVVEALA